MHPLIPFPTGFTLTSEQLRVKAATETYQHCKNRGWERVWAYLWTNRYRKGEWERWARSACADAIPVLKTTMICESHWRLVKHDYLHRFSRPRIDHVAHIVKTRLVPHVCTRVDALLAGNTRKATSSWKCAFVKLWRKAEERDEVSAESLSHFGTCAHRWTCACEPFLGSRFLFCKHLVKTVQHMSANNLKEMHRHRTPPFWTHPSLVPLQAQETCPHCSRRVEDANVHRNDGGENDGDADGGDGDGEDGDDGEGDDEDGGVGGGDEDDDDDDEGEASVEQLFGEMHGTLTRLDALLRRERPWASRGLIEAMLRTNRQNIRLLEEDDRRMARQSPVRTWQPGQHPAAMYLRGDERA
ncbi:hypothetical protein CF319_g7095 [Tilletia indica]|nr:hypothetical protein CF319_g7095 [Tilletia indica]